MNERKKETRLTEAELEEKERLMRKKLLSRGSGRVAPFPKSFGSCRVPRTQKVCC